MRKTIYVCLVLFLLAAYVLPANVFAVVAPNFPVCTNPQGILRDQHNVGTHGVAGLTQELVGSDTVYKVTSETYTQCFCADDGSGIQTNWWKVSSLTTDQVNILKHDGWIYIPNGLLWGLEEAPYLASNSDYGCIGNRIGGVQNDPGSNLLSLASTGNSSTIYLFASLGLILFALGLFLPKRRHE